MKKTSISYFIHGTYIDNRVWQASFIEQLMQTFNPNGENEHRFLTWNAINSTHARELAVERLLGEMERDEKLSSVEILNIIGHSHGGTIALMANDAFRKMVSETTQINILTLNTPCIVEGPAIKDDSIRHFNVISRGDRIVPIAGFNRTGKIMRPTTNDGIYQKWKYGEFSHRKLMNSGEIGTVNSEFPHAANVTYKDQYYLKGFDFRSHITQHRGFLKKNVEVWLPQLKDILASI